MNELTPQQAEKFGELADHIEYVADLIDEPMDPKVQALLYMVVDCIRDQIDLNKYYPWSEEDTSEEEDIEKPDYRFLSNVSTLKRNDIPSADDLESWISNGAPRDDNDDAE